MIGSAFLFSFGGGLLTGSINSALAEADDGSLAMANGFFGVGAVAGTADRERPGRHRPRLAGGPRLRRGVLCVHDPARAVATGGKDAAEPRRHGARGLLRRRLYVLLVAVIAIDVAAEAGFIGWIATYADEARGFPDWLAAGSPMAFWMGVTTIRFISVRARPSRGR